MYKKSNYKYALINDNNTSEKSNGKMSKKDEAISLMERWKMDIQSYQNGAKPLVSTPQCETCENYIRGNALYCKRYVEERKSKYVLFPEKECQLYVNSKEMKLTISDDRTNKIYGGLFGFCVGDIVGVPVEFSTREERKRDPVKEMRAYGTYHQPFGTWSDDTSLTLCLVDAVNKGYSIDKVAQNMVDFYENAYFTPHGEVFDVGNSTRDAIKRISSGKSPIECGGMLDSDNGNGSLMRILPIAFCGKEFEDKALIKMIEDISSLTHGHKRSKLACIFYVEFAIRIFSGDGKAEALENTIDFIRKNCLEFYRDEIRNFDRIMEKKIVALAEDDIRSTGYVVDTLEAALWVFFHAEGYREAILKAVNLGSDTDTIAAIAGGIAGIYYGVMDIPENWIQSIVRKEELQQIFEKFVVDCCKGGKGIGIIEISSKWTQYKKLMIIIERYINNDPSMEVSQKFCDEFMDMFFTVQDDLEQEVDQDIYEKFDDLNLVCDAYEPNVKIREMDKYCIDEVALKNKVMGIYERLTRCRGK